MSCRGGPSSSCCSSCSSEDGDALRWLEDEPRARRQTWSEVTSPGNPGRASQRAPRHALAIFNKADAAKKGIKELRAQGLLGDDAQAVCSFLLNNDGKLDLGEVGDYLGSDPSVGDWAREAHEVCKLVIGTLPLQGFTLDSALRRMIALVKLPGEAQKIDRIIEVFATHLCACNPGVIDHVDTAQVMAFSLVMLNVDAHNDNIKKEKKMTQQQYINNLRGICKDGSSPDPKMLAGMYVSICKHRWEARRSTVKVPPW